MSILLVTTPDVTPSHRLDGRVLALYRTDCGVSLTRAAAASGLTIEDIGAIEYGASTFASLEDRIAYVAALEGTRERRTER